MARPQGVMVTCRECHSAVAICHPTEDHGAVVVECLYGKGGKCRTLNAADNQALAYPREWCKWDKALGRYVLEGR